MRYFFDEYMYKIWKKSRWKRGPLKKVKRTRGEGWNYVWFCWLVFIYSTLIAIVAFIGKVYDATYFWHNWFIPCHLSPFDKKSIVFFSDSQVTVKARGPILLHLHMNLKTIWIQLWQLDYINLKKCLWTL